MACPFFVPIKPADPESRTTSRAPLGAVHEGRCEHGTGDWHRLCNFGYARRECDRFPSSYAYDAVRFSWRGDRLVYVLEANYAPAKFGYSDEIAAGSTLALQAHAFARSVSK